LSFFEQKDGFFVPFVRLVVYDLEKEWAPQSIGFSPAKVEGVAMKSGMEMVKKH
jgi:hypothetical protein